MSDLTYRVKGGVGYWRHPTAHVDSDAVIGQSTKIWHFSHVRATAHIGEQCTIGQNCYIEGTVGDHVKVQNNVSVYRGVMLEDWAFVGPSVVFTNDRFPRSASGDDWTPQRTLVMAHASLGAGAVIRCDVFIGAYAMVAAGAVVTHDVPPFALVQGNPARIVGWVCRKGHPMQQTSATNFHCDKCRDDVVLDLRYSIVAPDGNRRELFPRPAPDAG